MITPVSYSIHNKDQHPLFGDGAIHVTVASQGGGEYIILTEVNPVEPNNAEEFGAGRLTLEFEQLDEIMEIAAKFRSDFNDI